MSLPSCSAISHIYAFLRMPARLNSKKGPWQLQEGSTWCAGSPAWDLPQLQPSSPSWPGRKWGPRPTRWKRFLARGDNTCRTVLRREFMLREEGGLFLKSHTHPHPCPGLLPWRPGPGSVRKPQLEGGRSRVRDRTGGEWRPLTVTINSIWGQLSNS